jgi:hypothetical protein
VPNNQDGSSEGGPAQEKALFVLFWKWLGVAFAATLVIVGALAFAAVHGAQKWFTDEFRDQMADAKQRLIESEKDARQRFLELEKYSIDKATNAGISAKTSEGLVTKSEELVAKAQEQTKEATAQAAHLREIIDLGDKNRLSPADIENVIRSLVTNDKFSSTVAALFGTQLEAFSGPRVEATRNPLDPNWSADGVCPIDSTLVNFYCQIDSGGGNLQNLGVRDGRYHCLWTNVGGNFRASGQPLCLRLKKG